MLTRRITTPLRRLTEASRDLAEGDFARRVPPEAIEDGPIELSELGLQFNAMAERLQESIEIIRRDRDRSREFLADVSHELRTPIAALRTFNELLTEGAADDPTTRAEFLETSRAQLERLDWLAQNLLELSKLDSGLVLLDLRPRGPPLVGRAGGRPGRGDGPPPRRRASRWTGRMRAIPIRHDPVRIGQVVTNLVGNGIKFTPRGGHVDGHGAGRSPTVPPRSRSPTPGIGIDPAELPRIFDRFFRGSRASEARGQRERPRPGDRPEHRRDARRHGRGGEPAGRRDDVPGHAPAQPRPAGRRATSRRVAETSSSPAQNLNPEPAP